MSASRRESVRKRVPTSNIKQTHIIAPKLSSPFQQLTRQRENEYNTNMKSPWDKRFWAKVEKTDTCWNWIAGCKGKGKNAYPSFNGQVGTRFLWEKLHGSIPEGMVVMHKCDNTRCVRPDHLILGTNKENMEDAAAKKRMARGIRHGRAKLTPETVIKIRQLYRPYEFDMNAVAAKLAISKWSVYDVLRGRTWRWLPSA